MVLMSSEFLIMLDGAKSDTEVLSALYAKNAGAVPVKQNSCDIKGNWLEVRGNDDHDPAMLEDPEDGFLFYRWRVEVTPMDNGISVDNQIQLARSLLDVFRAHGWRAVVAASFEDQV